MPNRDLIVIGASAGGIEALREICAGLPENLDTAVLIVIHMSPSSGTVLSEILSRSGPLRASYPVNGEAIKKGRIYIAPPDYHMIVEGRTLQLWQGPRENHSRPAIDPTFRSAALAYGPRVIGVILTGLLDDGTSGLMVVKAQGGEAVVQNPKTAMFSSMPQNALDRVPQAHVADLSDIPGLLLKLTTEPIRAESKQNELARSETRISEIDMAQIEKESRAGEPSQFACPECGGVLWEIEQGNLLRYRCRVGHAYTAQHLRAEQRHAVETALWSALRALEESASLYKRMAEKARQHQATHQAYRERAENAELNARTLRDFLLNVNSGEQELSTTSEVSAD